MFFNKKSRRNESAENSPVVWKLPTVTHCLRELLPTLESAEIEPALIEARLADQYRDVGRQPVSTTQFKQMVRGFDTEAWRRFALAIGCLDHVEVRPVLAQVTQTAGQVGSGFVALAKNTDALTLAILRQSEVRIEEFARHFASYLGVSWHGETAAQSQERLLKIDYKRLLAEAEDAKKSAEDRMAALRKKQDEELAKRRPRGKQ